MWLYIACKITVAKCFKIESSSNVRLVAMQRSKSQVVIVAIWYMASSCNDIYMYRCYNMTRVIHVYTCMVNEMWLLSGKGDTCMQQAITIYIPTYLKLATPFDHYS